MKRIKTLTFLGLICFGLVFSTQAQEEILKVSVSRDTLTTEETLEYRIVLENSSGRVELPSFKGFSVVSGPNTSSSYSMINGKVSQSRTWQIYLQPSHIGTHTIPPATIITQDGRLESQSMQVFVVEAAPANGQEIPLGPARSNDAKSSASTKRILRKI